MRRFADNLWNEAHLDRPGLIVLSSNLTSDLWSGSTIDLTRQLAERLPHVHISLACSDGALGLRPALAAARFLGVREVVVVQLWGSEPLAEIDVPEEGVAVKMADAPPESEAVAAAYHTVVALHPDWPALPPLASLTMETMELSEAS